MAELKVLPLKVHYDEDSLATVLSVKDVANIENVKIIMDTSKERAISVIIKGDRIIKFLQCNSGLYYFDTDHPEKHECFLALYPLLTNPG